MILIKLNCLQYKCFSAHSCFIFSAKPGLFTKKFCCEQGEGEKATEGYI